MTEGVCMYMECYLEGSSVKGAPARVLKRWFEDLVHVKAAQAPITESSSHTLHIHSQIRTSSRAFRALRAASQPSS